MQERLVEPLGGPVDAVVAVPGSKSFTNRALVVAALAQGPSVLDGALASDDTAAMATALGTLGVSVATAPDRSSVAVEGAGGRIAPGPAELHAGLSGTAARFLLPLITLGTGRYRLDGAPPLRARPMGPLIVALRQLGVSIDDSGDPGHLPVWVDAGGLIGGEVRLSGAVSSQFATGLLLSAPAMAGGLRLELEPPVVSRPYLDITVATMAAFGIEVQRDGDNQLTVVPGRYQGRRYAVEPDASAASYFFAAAAVCGGRVRVPGLGGRSVQGDLAFVDVLERMGVEVVRHLDATEVVGTGTLQGVDVDMRDCSDTAQTLAAVAVFASSPTRISGIGFIRGKETDRIAAVVRELRRCGIDAVEEDDGFLVRPGEPQPARIETYDDHRMAMSFAVLGLRAPGIVITDPGCVAKTFPDFFTTLDRLRAQPTTGSR